MSLTSKKYKHQIILLKDYSENINHVSSKEKIIQLILQMCMIVPLVNSIYVKFNKLPYEVLEAKLSL